jgi:hypothetical protein
MKLVSKLASAGALLGLAASSLLAGAPANASGTGTACPVNRLCLYFNSDYEGARADFAYSDAGLNNEFFTDGPAYRNGWGVPVNNNAASVKNRTGSMVFLHDGPDCDGTGYTVYPGEDYNLSSRGLQNKVSSFSIEGMGVCIYRDQGWA